MAISIVFGRGYIWNKTVTQNGLYNDFTHSYTNSGFIAKEYGIWVLICYVYREVKKTVGQECTNFCINETWRKDGNFK
jgi:hypothetical protein